MSSGFVDGDRTDPTRGHGAPPDYIADPGPVGLAGFAMTTVMLSCVNAGLVGGKVEAAVLPLAFFYGGLVQLLAGMWEFRKANTFGALAFSSYGAFWLSFAALVKLAVPGLPAADATSAVALYLLLWTIFTAYMTIAALRTTVAILLVFIVLTITFALLTAAKYSGSAVLGSAGGWAGIVDGALAWYASFAAVTNSTFKKTVLPVVPLARA
jgi:uncharacterized protein